MRGPGERMPELVSGTVTSFDIDKGYGYIAQGGGRELFANQAIHQRHDPHRFGFGAHVVFQVIQGKDVPHVSMVRPF